MYQYQKCSNGYRLCTIIREISLVHSFTSKKAYGFKPCAFIHRRFLPHPITLSNPGKSRQIEEIIDVFRPATGKLVGLQIVQAYEFNFDVIDDGALMSHVRLFKIDA